MATYFAHRYIKHRKLVSLTIAGMAAGWGLVALDDALVFDVRPWPGLAAFGLAMVVWYAIVRVERMGR